jgi:hypothetical protein
MVTRCEQVRKLNTTVIRVALQVSIVSILQPGDSPRNKSPEVSSNQDSRSSKITHQIEVTGSMRRLNQKLCFPRPAGSKIRSHVYPGIHGIPLETSQHQETLPGPNTGLCRIIQHYVDMITELLDVVTFQATERDSSPLETFIVTSFLWTVWQRSTMLFFHLLMGYHLRWGYHPELHEMLAI